MAVTGNTETYAASKPKAPTVSKKSGTYTSKVSVTVKKKTKGSVIYYTTNGKDPKKGKSYTKKYKKAITLSKTTTLKVRAYKSKKYSSTVKRKYTVRNAAPSVTNFYQTTGKTTLKLKVPSKTTVYYTTNGKTPTTKSSKYTGKTLTFTGSGQKCIKAIAYKKGCKNSSVCTKYFYNKEESNNTPNTPNNPNTPSNPNHPTDGTFESDPNTMGGRDYLVTPNSPDNLTLRIGKDTVGHEQRYYSGSIASSTNIKVLYSSPGNHSEYGFEPIAPGTADLKYVSGPLKGKVIHVTVTGKADTVYYPALKKVEQIVNAHPQWRSPDMSDLNKAVEITKYVADTYKYDSSPSGGAWYTMLLTGCGGDCVSGSVLVCAFLDELGFPSASRFAGEDPVSYGQVIGGHANTLAILDGKSYIIDGTPGSTGNLDLPYAEMVRLYPDWVDPNSESATYRYIVSLGK